MSEENILDELTEKEKDELDFFIDEHVFKKFNLDKEKLERLSKAVESGVKIVSILYNLSKLTPKEWKYLNLSDDDLKYFKTLVDEYKKQQ